MSKRNSSYWKNRFELIEQSSNTYGRKVYSAIEPAFYKAEREIQKSIDSWYHRIAVNNEISFSEAKRLLSTKELAEFKWDLKAYIKHGEQNGIDQKWLKQLENASARYHITRLEAIKIQTQHALERAFGNELDCIDDMTRKIYSDNYYKGIYEIQRGFSIGFDVTLINSNKLDMLVKKPWAVDGKNFSDRIWKSKTTMVNELHNEIVRMAIMGESPQKAINHMSQFVDKKFKKARSQAGRLVMTEQAFFSSASQKDCFNDLGIDAYEIVATLDNRTSKVCQDLDGQVFPMSEYMPGATAPPFHVWCRSTTAPFFDDDLSNGSRIARGGDGVQYYVPSDMQYSTWHDKYIKDNPQALLVEKKWKNRNSDKSQYDRYKEILGKDIPNSFDKFQELKYNSSEEWKSLRVDYKILNKIENKNWNEEFKKKAIDNYKEFKKAGYIMDSHFLGRFLQRGNYKGYPEINKDDVLEIIKKTHNFKQEDRNIYFDKLKQMALIQNSDSKEFISFVRRKTQKGDWE